MSLIVLRNARYFEVGISNSMNCFYITVLSQNNPMANLY
ncbi:hypothetical protein MNV_2090006 [Candidatus Methanoperedens nitroreducens]|uniref:Uncharacterized protein n=1 Tax=Candidatus Methanoperedens nitratireducens TaxID=1392998 RepID=A0A284VNV6_9EURY|nr:hypothetical protein MNV_2090006 [Candidatus Methanoperedens nitroreducens]